MAGRVAVMIEIVWRNCNNMVWNNECEVYSTFGLHALCNCKDGGRLKLINLGSIPL